MLSHRVKLSAVVVQFLHREKWSVMVQQNVDMWSVGGLFRWFWESPEVAARGGGGLSAGYSPQPGYSQLRNQIPLCTQCPKLAPDTMRVGYYLPDEKPRRRAKAFPTVCKRMHERQLRKSKLYRSFANARTASDANSSAALRQTIAVSFASAGRVNVGTIGSTRLSSVGFFAGMMGNPSLMGGLYRRF
jgi:hypothetical protein